MILEGQERLSTIFENMPLSQLPQTFMLLGEVGCGKHTLATKLASYYQLDYLDITEHISNDVLSELALSPMPTLYIVDTQLMNERQQNTILKFIEDYRPNSWTCLICSNKNLLLETIVNRCIVYTFDAYTKEFLKGFAESLLGEGNCDKALELSATVGQLNAFIGQDLTKLESLCDKIIHKIKLANLSNVLSIANQFNYKDLYDKFNVDIFFKLMCKKLQEECLTDIKYLSQYKITQEYAKRLNDARVNKQYLLENYLIQLWR